MKIQLCTQFPKIYQPIKQEKSAFCTVKHDTVSFGAMKKSQFQGLDLYVIEKFKAPIEKFKTNEDLQNWAKKEYKKILAKDFPGKYHSLKHTRKEIIDEWANYIIKENEAYTDAQRLLILDGITKELNPKSQNLPPSLNKGTLAKTIQDLEQILKVNPKFLFNFQKIYQKTAIEKIEKLPDEISNYTGWIKIPSHKNDPENFKNNVEKLKSLSHHNWCTKTLNAEPYLFAGDFHIYLENGKPKVGIRFYKDKIREIQGERNNSIIPFQYYETITEHLEKGKFEVEDVVAHSLNKMKNTRIKFKEAKSKIEKANETEDYDAILKALNIDFTKDENGLYSISEYSAYDNDFLYTVSDLGVKESKLFEKIKEINGDANFNGSSLSTFKTLKKINGNANFSHTNITSLGSLEEVKNKLYLGFSVTDFGNLKKVGGDVALYNSKITSLQNLEEIGGTLRTTPILKDFGKLKKIGNSLIIEHDSIITSLGNIEEIGGYASLFESQIRSLGNLKRVGRELRLGKHLQDLGKLEEIGHIATFNSPDTQLSIKDRKRLAKMQYAIRRNGLKEYQKHAIIDNTIESLDSMGYSNFHFWFKNLLDYMTISQIEEIDMLSHLLEYQKRNKLEFKKKDIEIAITTYKEELAKIKSSIHV